jgi:trimeric autotransporter adhesin
MVRTNVFLCVILLLMGGVVPAWAQNNITCVSGTGCKKGYIAGFASNGGAATVADSIIKQTGSTISVTGSETTTMNISAGGNISANGNVSGGSISTTGNISGVNVSATGNVSGGSVSTTGNISGANVSATGNVSGATVSATGNVSGGNVSASSNVSAGGNVTATGNLSGANVSAGSNITAGGNVNGGLVNATTGFDIGGAPFAFPGPSGTTFFGFAGNSTTTGTDDTATGAGALESNTSGSGEVAYGQAALVKNTTGNDNAAFGTNALFSNTTGSENTALGVDALESNTTGSGLTCVGFACTAADDLHDATAIGAHAMVKVSDALVLGSVAGVNGAIATTMVGIGTASPTNLLTLGQGAGPSIADGWATYSSRRWKTNIQTLHNALDMVEQLRGVSYEVKESGKHEIGVIAEEVGEVVPEVVSYEKNGTDARGVDYSRLTALLIEAVKQQQGQIKTQQQQIARLNGKVGVLEATLRTVQHVGKLPTSIRSSAIRTHGLSFEQTKTMGQQGN